MTREQAEVRVSTIITEMNALVVNPKNFETKGQILRALEKMDGMMTEARNLAEDFEEWDMIETMETIIDENLAMQERLLR